MKNDKGKKPAAASAPPARGRTTAIAVPSNWDKELERFAKKNMKMAEASAGGALPWLTFQGGRLKYMGAELKDNQTDLIVLAQRLENDYYEGAFDPDNPTVPICFAFAEQLEDMAPHEASPKPQHETCEGCPQNEWGSSETGRGKACKNIRRLAMIPWGDGTAEQLEKAEIAFAKLPVTSVKIWDKYVTALIGRRQVPQSVVTRLSVESDSKNQFSVFFESVEAIPKELRGVVLKRIQEAERIIVPDVPYQVIEREERAPARPRSKGKPAAKKKAAAQPSRRSSAPPPPVAGGKQPRAKF